MNRFFLAVAATILVIGVEPAVRADDAAKAAADCVVGAQPTADLRGLLERVADSSKKRFIVTRTVPAQIVIGTIDPKSITYPVLVSILRNNELAVVSVQGVINVVREDEIRQFAIPTITRDDPSIADDEWVTEVVRTQHANVAQLVPILRPLLPRAGHMAALPDQHALVIVDHYGNVRRIRGLIQALDTAPTGTT